MAALTRKAVAAYRDERFKQVKPATVIRELAFLLAIINHARREWDINITNPIALIRKSPPQAKIECCPPTSKHVFLLNWFRLTALMSGCFQQRS